MPCYKGATPIGEVVLWLVEQVVTPSFTLTANGDAEFSSITERDPD